MVHQEILVYCLVVSVNSNQFTMQYINSYIVFIALGYLVATPVFAIVSDKYRNRRYPVMIGTSCLIISTLCFAWASNYSTLVVARICQGASAGASW